MHFLGIGKFILLMMVFPQVKTGVEILKGNVDKIKDIYHDDIREFFVVLTGDDAAGIFPSPVVQAAAFHIVLVLALYLDITAAASRILTFL
jgi:hypothetical protein